MSNNPPTWPNGAPPPGGQDPSPFRPLQPPPYGAYPPAPGQPAPYGSYAAGNQPENGAFIQGQPYASEPYTGLGTPPPRHVSIEDFAPKPDRKPLLIVGVTAALAIVALVTAILVASRPPAAAASASPTPAPYATPSQGRTPSPGGVGVEFQSSYDHASGFWEIRKQTWQPDGLLLDLAITVDQGALTPTFYVFNNGTNAQYRVELSAAPEPRFPATTLAGPNTFTGQAFVKMPRVDGTLIMISGKQVDAVSALPITK